MILIIGTDGTGKTVISSKMAEAAAMRNEKVGYVDLDGTATETLRLFEKKYLVEYDWKNQEEELQKGKINLFCLSTVLSEDFEPDYMLRVEKLREFISKKWDLLVLDGLSSFKYDAEQVMRITVETPETEELRFKYWVVRNRVFLSTIEFARIASQVLVGTALDDLNPEKEKPSALTSKLNALATYRLQLDQIKASNATVFTAKVTKDRFSSLLGAKVKFMAFQHTKTLNKKGIDVTKIPFPRQINPFKDVEIKPIKQQTRIDQFIEEGE